VASHQIVFGVILIVLLLAMAGFYAWRQGRTLGGLRQDDLEPQERRYLRNQAWRRLVGSALMVVLAVMLAAHFVLEEQANKLVTEGESNQQQGIKRPLHQEEAQFVNFYRNFWGFFVLVLFALIIFAGWDYVAIRTYGKRQYRQIQADRRAMIESELARLRSQRNGHDS